jgi:iron(III) transport system substrate-binding protein
MTNKPAKKDRGWRDDEFARHEVLAQLWWLVIPLIAIVTAMLLSPLWHHKPLAVVVVYAAQDQVYAEPILRGFEKETGIKVKAVYDSEAVKTVGLANRLVAERNHPQCDVFWGNEEMRTIQLATQDVFRETNGWAAFGYRSRRIVINTNFVAAGILPAVEGGILPPGSAAKTSGRAGTSNAIPPGWKPGLTDGRRPAATSLLELTNESWRGKVALAFPQFGTTATHFHALRQLWGQERWFAWCRALAANQPFMVDGNSIVVQFVGRGEAWIGLTDSDDIAAGQREGLPIAALPLTAETLLIPNTVAVVRNAPHPANAQSLFEYLQRREVAAKLVQAHALESATLPEGRVTRVPDSTTEAEVRDSRSPAPRENTLNPDWASLLRDLETTTKQLNGIFLR